MKVVVACECSGVVRDAFRKRGHDAWSCDIKPSETPSDFHHQGDVLKFLKGRRVDLLIAHPPCTYLTNADANKWKAGDYPAFRYVQREAAKRFFMALWNFQAAKVCVENPVGIFNRKAPPYSDHSAILFRTPNNKKNVSLAAEFATA